MYCSANDERRYYRTPDPADGHSVAVAPLPTKLTPRNRKAPPKLQTASHLEVNPSILAIRTNNPGPVLGFRSGSGINNDPFPGRTAGPSVSVWRAAPAKQRVGRRGSRCVSVRCFFLGHAVVVGRGPLQGSHHRCGAWPSPGVSSSGEMTTTRTPNASSGLAGHWACIWCIARASQS